MVLLSNQSFNIIQKGDFNDPNFWLIADHIALNNATITDGEVFMSVNETEGSECIFSGVQQGKLPHGWYKKDSIKEVEVKRSIETSENVMFITVVANRSEFKFYDDPHNFVNIGFMIWIELDDDYDEPVEESCQLELDISIASFTNQSGTVEPITQDFYFKGSDDFPDRDYHYIDSANNEMLENDTFYEITIDVGKSIAKAFKQFKITKGKLKSFDIYIEAKYGYGEAEIEYVEFVFSPKLNSGYVVAQSFFYGILAFFGLTVMAMILRRMHDSKTADVDRSI